MKTGWTCWRQRLTNPRTGRALARRGGFPTPALQLANARDRAVWFDGYVRTYLERDLQEQAAIDALPDFRRLMRAGCHRLGQLVNQTELGREVALPQPTVHRWLNLLETSYLLVRLPAYSVNRTKRLIKSPKLYWATPVLRCICLNPASQPVCTWRIWCSRTCLRGAMHGLNMPNWVTGGRPLVRKSTSSSKAADICFRSR